MEIVFSIVGLLLLLYVVFTIFGGFQVLIMDKAQIREVTKEKQRQELANMTFSTSEWTADNDFKFVGYFISKVWLQTILISTWQRIDRPTFLCQYIVRSDKLVRSVIDIFTEFADDICLTTANSSDGQLFPRPYGYYNQTFINIDIDTQWDIHIQMENYLMDFGGVELVQCEKSFEESIMDYTRKLASFIRSIKGWPFCFFYWYFIRRRLWHGKSVKVQHERGMIKLPNELRLNMSD